jgi:tetratricopeptide (TPR) repeat protein
MLKKLEIYKYGLMLVGLVFLPVSALGQDLGSSSGLFSNPKTRTPASKTSARKSVPERKGAVVARGKNTRNAARPKAANKSASGVEISKASRKSVIVTIGDKGNGDFEGLFERAIDEGNAARNRRQYAKAETAYLRARNFKAKDSRAAYGLGNIYSDQQRWEEAEQAYRTAIQIEPASPEAYIALSFVLTQPIVGETLSARYGDAQKYARRAIQIDPRSALAYDQIGVSLELSGKVSTETQEAYRKAIELEPTFALAYAHLGRLLRKTGATAESAAAYRDAVRHSLDAPTMIRVAEVMQSQQMYLESEELLRRALVADEKNPAALLLLGRALTTRGKFEEAEKILQTAAEVSANGFYSYTLLGSLAARRERFAEAENYLMQAASLVSPNERKRLAQEFEAVGDGLARAARTTYAARVFRHAGALDNKKTALVDKLNKAQAN